MTTAHDKQAPPKVLIVDDSRIVRASLIKLIRGRFEFREEADGEAGWQALVVDPSIQLVLSDIDMPQLDGFGLLQRIRSARIARVQELPVIMISGDEDDAVRERARQLGANDFIAKGIGAVELLARLDSLSRLAQTRRELEESRSALARQSQIDPASGLVTEACLNWQGAKELALARRHHSHIGTLVIDIDRYDELAQTHGAHVAQLVTRKLAAILATKVRQEDTVTQLTPSRFAVLSPSTDLVGGCAFALRLRKAIDKLVLTYRETRLRISITAGVASSSVDGMSTMSHLLELAGKRAEAGRALGGNRVMAERGEVRQEEIERLLRQALSIDRALSQLRLGDANEVAARLPEVITTLLPLLELLESRLRCGIPLERLKGIGADGAAGNAPAE